MSLVKRALFFSFLGKYSSLMLDFVGVMIIARVLTPKELGAYSLAAGSIIIGQMLRDFGLSLYIIKEKDLTIDKIQGCFTISILLCWTIAAVYYLSAGFIGQFFDNPEITTLVQILSLSFFFLPFGPIMISLLKRELKFEKIMVVNVTGTFVSVLSTLALLYFSFGVISLAIGVVLGSFTAVMFAVYYGEWKYYRFNFTYVVEIFKFSSFVSMSNILGQLRSIVPEAIIGKFMSADAVAYFAKGIAVLNLFSSLILSIVGSVTQPFIAKLNHKDEKMDTSIYQVLNYVLVLQWPFCVFVYLFSSDLVYVLYGPQWTDSVVLTKIFAVFLFFDGFIVLADQLLNAVGKVKYIFKCALIITVLRILLVYIFVNDGLVAIALSFGILTALRLLIIFPKMYSTFGLEALPLLKLYGRNFAISGIILIAGWTINLFTSDLMLYLRFVINSAILGLVWLAMIFIFKHDLRHKVLSALTQVANKLQLKSS